MKNRPQIHVSSFKSAITRTWSKRKGLSGSRNSKNMILKARDRPEMVNPITIDSDYSKHPIFESDIFVSCTAKRSRYHLSCVSI